MSSPRTYHLSVRQLRLALAAVLSAVGLALSASSAFAGVPRVCADEVTDQGAVRACRPVEVTDAVSVLWLLALAACLSPEFSEMTVGGVGFKRRLETEQQVLRREVAAVLRTEDTLVRALDERLVAGSVDDSVERKEGAWRSDDLDG